MKSMRSLLASVAVLLLLGCNIQDLEFEDIQGIQLDGVYAAPIGETVYTMDELLVEIGDTTELQEDDNGVLFLEYSSEAIFTTSSDIVNIGDVINDASFDLPVTPPVATDQTITFDTTVYFEYAADQSERIDSVFYLSGNLVLNATLSGTSNVNFDISLPTTINLGLNQMVSFSGSTNFLGGPYALSNHKTTFTYQSATNVYPVDVHLEIPLTAGQQIPAGETFNVEISLLNQTFSEIFGRFGRDTVTVGNTTINIPFFEDFNTEGFFLDAPTITFDFENSFGVPFGVLFGGLYSVNDNSGVNDTTYLEGNITNSPQLVSGASQPGESGTTSIVINKSNSTLDDLLSTTPDQLGFDIRAVSNPTDLNALNFLSGSNEVQTDILVRMDLAVRLEDLTRDVEFNLSGGLEFNEIDSAVLRVVTINKLPFSGTMELFILGEAQDTLYAAPENLVLKAPLLNLDGTVKENGQRNNTADIILGPQGVEALKTGNKVVLHLTLNTTVGSAGNDLFVKIRRSDSITIKASVAAGAKYQF